MLDGGKPNDRPRYYLKRRKPLRRSQKPLSRTTPLRRSPLRRVKGASSPGPQKSPTRPSQHYELLLDGALKVFPDGREVCTDTPQGWALYKDRIRQMVEWQNGLCCLCAKPLRVVAATFEHEAGRGFNGAHRDDRILDNEGRPINGAAHFSCNNSKGSRRVQYAC